MKAYFFTSPYLSDIQKGIQVSHATVEMSMRAYRQPEHKITADFAEWALNHKTMVVLSYGFDKIMADRLFMHLVENENEGNDNDRFFAEFLERELNQLPTLGVVLRDNDCRVIGNFRQSRRFKVSQELGAYAPFWNVDDEGTMSKRDWLEALGRVEEDVPIAWYDFLRIVSTFTLA